MNVHIYECPEGRLFFYLSNDTFSQSLCLMTFMFIRDFEHFLTYWILQNSDFSMIQSLNYISGMKSVAYFNKAKRLLPIAQCEPLLKSAYQNPQTFEQVHLYTKAESKGCVT